MFVEDNKCEENTQFIEWRLESNMGRGGEKPMTYIEEIKKTAAIMHAQLIVSAQAQCMN